MKGENSICSKTPKLCSDRFKYVKIATAECKGAAQQPQGCASQRLRASL